MADARLIKETGSGLKAGEKVTRQWSPPLSPKTEFG